jgi:ABC-type phosphate transport system permease subunit
MKSENTIKEEIQELQHKELLYSIVGMLTLGFFFILGFIIRSYPKGEATGAIAILLGVLISLPSIVYASFCNRKRKKLLRSI